MQLACGVVYVNKVTEERQEDKEKDREKWKIPAGTWSHQGASPGGERIKKKVIDIHFNPQLTTCHPIFSPETRKKSYRALGGQCEWTVGSRKKERKEEGERDLIPQTGWHTERNSWSPEKLKTIWDLKRHAGDERCMKNSMNWGKTKSCKQEVGDESQRSRVWPKKEQQTSGYSVAKDQCSALCTVIIPLLMMLTLSEQLHCV